MRGPRRSAGSPRGRDPEAPPVDESEHVQHGGGEHAPADDARRDRRAFRAEGREPAVAEDQKPVQADVQDVRTDHDHHPRDRAADTFEEKARRHVQQQARKPEAERRQHPAAAGRDVRGLPGREQERFPERTCERHQRAGAERVHERGAPDRATACRLAGPDGLGGHHHRAHQQPDPHEQQRDLRRDRDHIPREIVR